MLGGWPFPAESALFDPSAFTHTDVSLAAADDSDMLRANRRATLTYEVGTGGDAAESAGMQAIIGKTTTLHDLHSSTAYSHQLDADLLAVGGVTLGVLRWPGAFGSGWGEDLEV